MSDTLTVTSRNFFERTRGKVALSIITAAGGLFALGYCSSAGGNSQAFSNYLKTSGLTSDMKDAFHAAEAGYGKYLTNPFNDHPILMSAPL